MSEQNPPIKQLDANKPTEKKLSVVERQPTATQLQQDASTGAIQKRKSTFKAIKNSNSLKNSSSEIDGNLQSPFISLATFVLISVISFSTTETSNLLKFKNSHLGKSAPCKCI
jgi:hypothetical protein